MKMVDARYVGSAQVYSMRHDKVLNHGDVVKMPEAEAGARADFEVVKAPSKGAKKMPEKGGE
jgi:hypothetical protein